MTITVVFYAISTNKPLFSFSRPLEHVYNQFTSPPSQASNLHLRQQVKFPAHTLQLFHSQQSLAQERPGDWVPFGKANKASILCSTHMSRRPARCARTGLRPAPSARAHGTRRRGWWSQPGHRTGGRRWRRCRWSTAAWPTGTAWGQTDRTWNVTWLLGRASQDSLIAHKLVPTPEVQHWLRPDLPSGPPGKLIKSAHSWRFWFSRSVAQASVPFILLLSKKFYLYRVKFLVQKSYSEKLSSGPWFPFFFP